MELIRRGVPALALTTSQFAGLAQVMLRAQRMPSSAALIIDGNPEFFDDQAFAQIGPELAKRVLDLLTGSVRRAGA